MVGWIDWLVPCLLFSLSCKKAGVVKAESSFGTTVADYKERLTNITITADRVAKVSLRYPVIWRFINVKQLFLLQMFNFRIFAITRTAGTVYCSRSLY